MSMEARSPPPAQDERSGGATVPLHAAATVPPGLDLAGGGGGQVDGCGGGSEVGDPLGLLDLAGTPAALDQGEAVPQKPSEVEMEQMSLTRLVGGLRAGGCLFWVGRGEARVR
jgi:hypothetical protein